MDGIIRGMAEAENIKHPLIIVAGALRHVEGLSTRQSLITNAILAFDQIVLTTSSAFLAVPQLHFTDSGTPFSANGVTKIFSGMDIIFSNVEFQLHLHGFCKSAIPSRKALMW